MTLQREATDLALNETAQVPVGSFSFFCVAVSHEHLMLAPGSAKGA